MKPSALFTAIVVMMALSLPAGAQTPLRAWGFKIGMNQSYVTGGSDDFKTKPLYGTTVGMYWRFDLDEHFYAQTELLYAYKKTGIQRSDLDEWDRPLFHDVSIPVLVAYEFQKTKLPPIAVMCGFSPTFRIYTGNGNKWGGERGSSIHANRVDLTLMGGAGFRIPFRAGFITLDARIEFGRDPVFDDGDDPVFESTTFNLNTISILIGLPI